MSHGRTYPRLSKGARREEATNTAKLMFGMGLYCNPANMGTVMLATSSSHCPELFARIAADLAQPRPLRERNSIEIADRNIDCHHMTEVHIQIYRTGDYLLSRAQDYRAGKPAYQQHPWQATLGVSICGTRVRRTGPTTLRQADPIRPMRRTRVPPKLRCSRINRGRPTKLAKR